MAGTKNATYSKRTPLSDLSNKISLPARASTRLREAHSAENPKDHHQSAGTTIIYDDGHQQDNIKVILPSSSSVDNVISDAIAISEIKTVLLQDSLNVVATDHLQPKRSQRTITPRVPLNISRPKKKVTLAMHIRKFGSTHDIEC
jgi:hypothetical protein